MCDVAAIATFRLGSNSSTVWKGNRAMLKKASGETQTVDGKVTWHVDPTDAIALRGVPCVGPGCAGGAIRGTRPGDGIR